MVDHGKRKKHHDRDKYYRLAKEQGLRSRAAFKLAQINRKFHLLEGAKVVLDLCAAPGGWTQIASRTMARGSEGTIVAVDILPIRHINRNVITLIGDVTTEECQASIRRTLQTAPVDVVLCDGAPNVGATYDRDAYAQNEIALACLKCATRHLRANGSFVTKMYRSADYASYLWVARQLFREVRPVKPAASRAASSEIFLVCTGYRAPDKIDPRLLDPKSVFEQIDETDAAGAGGEAGAKTKKGKMTIFHKSYNDKKRSRQGYDMTLLDGTFRNIGTISEFIESPDPIQMLTDCTGLTFMCGQGCSVSSAATPPSKGTKTDGDDDEGDADGDDDGDDTMKCNCRAYLEHPLTSADVKACVADLKVLNKGDFKGLLTWRLKMQTFRDELLVQKQKSGDDDDGRKEMEDADVEGGDSDRDDDGEDDSDKEEATIREEVAALYQKKIRAKKREKKKERAIMAKRRRRAALGMDLNAIDVPETDQIFSLATVTSKGDLEAVREVDLDKVDKEILPMQGDDDGKLGDDIGDEEGPHHPIDEPHVDIHEDEIDQETGYSFRLDRELDLAYDAYLSKTKNKQATAGSRMEKRQKAKSKKKAVLEAVEDDEMVVDATAAPLDADTKAYAKLLQGAKDSDDDDDDDDRNRNESSDDESDGFHSSPATPQEHQKTLLERKRRKREEESGNPLLHQLPEPEEPLSVRTARWFSNPLFAAVGAAGHSASMPESKPLSGTSDSEDEESDVTSDIEMSTNGGEHKKNHEDPTGGSEAIGLDADEVLAMMPKTDKQVRHEKRLKAFERQKRKESRRAKLEGEGFEVVTEDARPASTDADISKVDEEGDLAMMDEGKRKRLLAARALIKAGMGTGKGGRDEAGKSPESDKGFEVVSSNAIDLPIMDERKYDSEHEDYDSDDHARTLALGTMMLRRSKAKALVDASYNRYAWNDPEDLPDWFLDDEARHYRPQLPIPPELVAKMKARFLALSSRPIAKVAEARARKNKRVKQKLVAAKKKAESVANNSDMSEAMKLRAISKAMRGQDASRPGKTYVVSKKGGKTKGGKGMKLVDKRMKNDKRGMDRAAKKRKGGKTGGLTGSKRRRHHK